jgi:hypothetical protein
MRRLKKAWKANPHTRGAAPKALPLLIAMPLRTRKGFRRDCAAAWPEAEFVVIQDHTDIRRWLERCAVSEAPAVIAICSLSQTKDFGNEWLPAPVEQRSMVTVPDLSDTAAQQGTPAYLGTTLVGYRDPETDELITRQETRSRFFCPDCGQPIEDVPLNQKDDAEAIEPVTSLTYFQLKRRWCRHCGASLNAKDRIPERRATWPHIPFAIWSRGVAAQPEAADPALIQRIIDAEGKRGPVAPDSFSPYDFLYRFFRGCVGIAIIDESHNLSGRDSHLARAGHLAMRAAQARILASGTHFAGTIDKFYHYWMRFNPRFWRKLGLGWNDLLVAIQRYGVVQHWVREVETAAKRGGRGQTEIREATIPAPGVSAKLLPHLLHELVFLTVLDVGAHMPPRIEIPEIIPMDDPALHERVADARAALAALEQPVSLNEPHVLNEAASVYAQETERSTAEEALAHAQQWARERDLAHHYAMIANTLESTAKSRQPGSTAARLAQGTIPRWFAALPCVAPPFAVQYRTRNDWGDVEATHTLLTTPILAYDHVYPLERRVKEIVGGELAEGRRVMLYFEQQNRSMAQRLHWLLADHTPWSLPDSVKAENREDAIRQAVIDGHTIVIVPFLRVSEGLNLQDVLDTIIWVELPKNLFTLDQASRRIWRLNKRETVRLYYLTYGGTAGYRKLRRLASQSGAAALFAGNTPDGQLVRSVGAHKTTLAQMSAGLRDEQSDMQAAFARRGEELATALKAGRQWIGVSDTLPERLRAMHQWMAATVGGVEPRPPAPEPAPTHEVATAGSGEPPLPMPEPAPPPTRARHPNDQITFGDQRFITPKRRPAPPRITLEQLSLFD